MVRHMSTRVRILGCLSVMLVIFQASSAPVHDIQSPQLTSSSSSSLEDYRSLPSYTSTVNKISQEYSKTVGKVSSLFSNFSCAACRYAVSFLKDMFDHRMSYNAIADAIGEICYLSKVQDENVCKGIVQVFKEEVLTVFSMIALSPEEVCAGYLSDCGSEYNPFNQVWNVSVPGNKPPYKPLPTPVAGAPVTRILQLTDLHYDPEYTEGLSNNCGEPLCCRPPNAKGSGSTAAGKWGDYKCDVPQRTVINLFEHLNNTQDQFDWVYWTGDVTPHNVWNQTRTGTLSQMKYFYSLFEQYLPNKPVFFTLGNHDTVPVNNFPQPFISGNQSKDWITDATLDSWSRWLKKFPDWNATQATIKKGGFYNIKVREGLRIIALQTTYCEKQNFWLLVNATDPAGQLQWLADQLLAAEKAGDKVHILGHHPPGMDSVPNYGTNYKRIVNRFENTIVGQFFGHTHTDTLRIYTDDNQRPTNVMYISPGVTSFPAYNFGYRIYTLDGPHDNSTHTVLDHETYIMDIAKANSLSSDSTPQWELEYSAKKAYNMSSLSPESYFDLWKRLRACNQSDPLFLLWSKHWHKGRTVSIISRKTALCEIINTTIYPNPLCTSATTSGEKAESTADLNMSQGLTSHSFMPRDTLK